MGGAVSTVASTHRHVTGGIRDFNRTVDEYGHDGLMGGYSARVARAARKRQLEDAYRAKLILREERKAKILEKFLYHQRMEAGALADDMSTQE